MRRTLCVLILITAIVGCKSSDLVNTKLDNKTERMLKGSWTLTAVNLPGSDYLKVNSFNIVDSQCFIGSDWNFVPNNNKGYMQLNNINSACKNFSSPITWYINNDGKFIFKIVNKHKAKIVNSGFVLSIKNTTETSFDLVDSINVAGIIKNITYSFQKNK
jgi:hypothetical protein